MQLSVTALSRENYQKFTEPRSFLKLAILSLIFNQRQVFVIVEYFMTSWVTFTERWLIDLMLIIFLATIIISPSRVVTARQFSKYFTPDIIVCKSTINRKYGVLWQLYMYLVLYRSIRKIDLQMSPSWKFYVKMLVQYVVHHIRENHRDNKPSNLYKLPDFNEYRNLHYNKNASDITQSASSSIYITKGVGWLWRTKLPRIRPVKRLWYLNKPSPQRRESRDWNDSAHQMGVAEQNTILGLPTKMNVQLTHPHRAQSVTRYPILISRNISFT